MPERELTPKERTDIRALVKTMCANYDYKHGCLPLDCPCYMLHKWWTGAYCKYFQSAVLPTNPTLMASLMGGGKELKPCACCGTPFLPIGRQVYCSNHCRTYGRRQKAAKRQRRYLQNRE